MHRAHLQQDLRLLWTIVSVWPETLSVSLRHYCKITAGLLQTHACVCGRTSAPCALSIVLRTAPICLCASSQSLKVSLVPLLAAAEARLGCPLCSGARCANPAQAQDRLLLVSQDLRPSSNQPQKTQKTCLAIAKGRTEGFLLFLQPQAPALLSAPPPSQTGRHPNIAVCADRAREQQTSLYICTHKCARTKGDAGWLAGCWRDGV